MNESNIIWERYVSQEVFEEHISTRKALRYDKSKGDKCRVTLDFKKDKARLTPEERRNMKTFFRRWKASRGTDPIFEAKTWGHLKELNREGQPYGKQYIYGIEVQKRVPPFHVIAVTESINNNTAILFSFIRIFTNYDDYRKYLSAVRSRAGK